MSLEGFVKLGHGVNQNFLLNFVVHEVNLGLRFCQIMSLGCASPDVYSKGEKRAQLALQHAEEYMWRLHIEHQRFDDLTSQVERLRFELMQLRGKQNGGR
jgi:hypothetical protein